MKKIIVLAVAMGIFLLTMISKAFLVANGTVHATTLETFAVDANENIYLGYRGRIDVYLNGEFIRRIEPPTNRDYVLKAEDGKLLIGRDISGKVGTYDFEGNHIEDIDLSYDELKREVSREKIIQQNNKAFKVNKYLDMKPFEVMCDDMVIYRMPTIDYIFNCLPFGLVWAFTFIFCMFLIPFIVTDEKIRNVFR